MKIGIAGGGIAGLTFMNFAKKAGVAVSLYEKKGELTETGSGLMLGINAMEVLSWLGLEVAVKERGSVLGTLLMTDEKGRVLSGADLRRLGRKSGQSTLCIERKELHDILKSSISSDGIQTGANVRGVECTPEGRGKFLLQAGESEEFDLLVAADGVHSTIRKQIFGDEGLRYSGYTCWRFIAELPHEQDPSVAVEMLGRGKRFGIMPVGGGKVYCYATLNAPRGSYPEPIGKDELANLFYEFEGGVPAIMDNFLKDSSARLIHRDLADLHRAHMANVDHNLIFAGDAGHATTPNLGQGADMGIEDAAIFASLLEKYWDKKMLLRRYNDLRIGRVEKIRNQSRRAGKINQLENGFFRFVRNSLMRLTPPRMVEIGMKNLLMSYPR